MDMKVDIYPSRQSSAACLPRQDPVVWDQGQHAGALTAEQLALYERQGFLVLPGLFNAGEVAELLAEVRRMAADPAIKARPEAITERGSDEIRSVFRVHALNERLAALAREPRLLDVARQILGSEVYLHQTRANLKPGFRGKEFYWHSDFETWHVEDGMPRMRALSCSVLLTDNRASNGPLMLVPGSHRSFISCVGATPDEHYLQSLKKQEYGVPDDDSLRALADEGGITTAEGAAGTVVFFDCNTMHGSASNISPWERANVFMVYNSMDNQLGPPKYGLSPRPEHIATREHVQVLKPLPARS